MSKDDDGYEELVAPIMEVWRELISEGKIPRGIWPERELPDGSVLIAVPAEMYNSKPPLVDLGHGFNVPDFPNEHRARFHTVGELPPEWIGIWCANLDAEKWMNEDG